MFDATAQNLVTTAKWRPVFLHPYISALEEIKREHARARTHTHYIYIYIYIQEQQILEKRRKINTSSF